MKKSTHFNNPFMIQQILEFHHLKVAPILDHLDYCHPKITKITFRFPEFVLKQQQLVNFINFIQRYSQFQTPAITYYHLTTPMLFNELLISINLYQHAKKTKKTQAFSTFCSRETYLIQKSCNLLTNSILAISQEPVFPNMRFVEAQGKQH